MTDLVDSLSIVVLAGGRSTRMGRDKAMLPHPVSHLPLILHQLNTAGELSPQLRMVSVHRGQPLPPLPTGVSRVEDSGDQGPLAGMVAALQTTTTSHLAVMPVDLPWIEAKVYHTLMGHLDNVNQGAFATTPDSPEPLVCILPRTLTSQLEQQLIRGHASPWRIFTDALKTRMRPVPFRKLHHFRNWNKPEDIGELNPGNSRAS